MTGIKPEESCGTFSFHRLTSVCCPLCVLKSVIKKADKGPENMVSQIIHRLRLIRSHCMCAKTNWPPASHLTFTNHTRSRSLCHDPLLQQDNRQLDFQSFSWDQSAGFNSLSYLEVRLSD